MELALRESKDFFLSPILSLRRSDRIHSQWSRVPAAPCALPYFFLFSILDWLPSGIVIRAAISPVPMHERIQIAITCLVPDVLPCESAVRAYYIYVRTT